MYKQLSAFRQNQEGGVLIIVAASMLLLLMVAGGAVDLSRYLVAKTQAQAAIDNAVLSAAAVKDTQNPTTVANEFFSSNYPADIGSAGQVTVVESDGGSTLTATVSVTVDALFGSFVGIDNYPFTVLGEVTLEGAMSAGVGADIVLTIDNSASMCQSSGYGERAVQDGKCTRLRAMKDAANEFVDLVLDDNPEGAYIGVVPFNHQVRMRGGVGKHPALNNNSVQITGGDTPLNRVLDLTNDSTRLHKYIKKMGVSWQRGWTRTNVGTAAAGAMLLPYAQDRQYFKHADGLPRAIDPDRIDKVLVLMTDGVNASNLIANTLTPEVMGATHPDNVHQAQLCAFFKDHYRFKIYTVVYDVAGIPDTIKDIFRDCATNEQYYFEATSNVELLDAYRTIANGINRIRLSR